MKSALLLSFKLASAISVVLAGENLKPSNCKEFTNGSTFNDSEALGIWHLQDSKTANDSEDTHCIELMLLSDEERMEMSKRYEDFLKWDNVEMKMQIPCASEKHPNAREYFLQKVEGNGNYITLQLPVFKPKGSLAALAFHRYRLSMKTLDGKYLSVMDCRDKFIFLLSRAVSPGPEDETVFKMFEIFWSEDY